MKKLITVLGLVLVSFIVYAADDSISIPKQQAQVINDAIQKGEDRVIKVGENHGKVQKVLKDKDGKDVVIAEYEFGSNYVYDRLAAINAELLKFKDPVWIQKQIDALEAEKTKVLEMKAILEGE